MSRAERLLALLQLLRRERRPVTARRLAGELGVSVRSIYRDVEALRRQGASIAGDAGLGYALRPGFLLPPLMFADEEVEALVLGLRLVAEHADASLGRAAADAMAKVRAVLPGELRAQVDEAGLLAGPSHGCPPEVIDLQQVRLSLRRPHKAAIAYVDGQGAASERVIWPVALGYFERVRVLVAWCELRGGFRAFRVDRIRSWRALSDPLPRSRRELLRAWREQEGLAAQLPDA